MNENIFLKGHMQKMNMKIVLVTSMLFCISLHAFTIWNNTSRKMKLTNVEYHALYPRLTYLQITQEKFISQHPYLGNQSDFKEAYVGPKTFASHKQIKSFRLGVHSPNSGMYILDKIVDGLDDHIGIALNETKDGEIYTTKFIQESLTIFNNSAQNIHVKYIDALSSEAKKLTLKAGESVPNFQASWSLKNDDGEFETTIETWHEEMPNKIYRMRYHGTEDNKSQGLIILQEDEHGAIISLAT